MKACAIPNQNTGRAAPSKFRVYSGLCQWGENNCHLGSHLPIAKGGKKNMQVEKITKQVHPFVGPDENSTQGRQIASGITN